jgi:hypothetical protein
MTARIFRLIPLILVVAFSLSCEIDTKLNVAGGNPPVFHMSGNGFLTSIRVRGDERQREVQGEDQYLYWVIEVKEHGGSSVEKIGSVTYGKVPEGYKQIYPETGEAPPIVEGLHYYVRVVTSEANGADGYFMLLNGKALFDPIDSELRKETKVSK